MRLGDAVWAASILALGACADHLDLGKNLHLDAGSCATGAYAGTFACAQGASTFQQAVSGPLAFTVVADLDDHGAITGFTVPPVDGTHGEILGGSFTGTLAGALDCPHARLVGTVTNVTVTSSGLRATLAGDGILTATYALDAGTPAFVDGAMTFPNLGDAAVAECTWEATHQ